MTDAATLQPRIWAGLARAGARLGSSFSLYRPGGTGPVLVPGNLRGMVGAQLMPMHGFGRPNLYGAAMRQLLADGGLLLPGDYLSDGGRTAFVASLEPLLPILAVACNRTIALHRPGGAAANGAVDAGYAGAAGTDVVLLQGWPASLLAGGGPTAGTPLKLPSDPVGGGWSLLLPAPPCLTTAGLVIAVGDRVTCDLGRRYAVASAELSALGWRVALGEIGI